MSDNNKDALYTIKSLEFSTKYDSTSFKLLSETNESGSSFSGRLQIFTFIPCPKIRSIPLKAARDPAASPSNTTVIFFVNLLISLI